MPKTREQKSVLVERLTKAFKGAKSVAFADYKGLTVPQADALRGKAREAGVEYVVAKKTLLTRAAKDAGYELDAKSMPGMLGAAFAAEDEMAPAKVLGDSAKGTSLTLVGGIFDGVIVPQEKIIALSNLPGRHDLLGMLVGTLNGLPAALVRALNAIREQKDVGAPAPTPVAEAPSAEEAPAATEEPKAESKTEDTAPVEAAPAPAEGATEEPKPEEPPASANA